MKRIILILTILLAAQPASRLDAQADWLDALLPANHLLEKIPFVDEGGQPVPGGLFTFEDLNADGRKDLLLAHREAVSADKLDQPHTQILIVCFFEPVKKVYSKVLDDEGGPLQWVRVVTDSKAGRRFLALEREDWQAQRNVRVYTLGPSGRMDKVAETQSPWSYASLSLRDGKVEVLYSAKAQPVSPGKAEDVFAWSETAKQFVNSKGLSVGKVALVKAQIPTPIVVVSAEKAPATAPSAGLPETGIEPAADVVAAVSEPAPVAAAPKPAEKKKAKKPEKKSPAPKAAEAAKVPETGLAPSAGTEPAGQPEVPQTAPAAEERPAAAPPAAGGSDWWGASFSAPTAYAKLKNEIIPKRVRNNQLTPLGQEAKAFFDQLNAGGIKGEEFSTYRAGYLTTVASELFAGGDTERGKYYLGLVLKYRPDFKDALDLQAKVAGGGSTTAP